MGLVERIRGLFGGDDEGEANYRCIRCGEGYERNHQSCPACGSEFLAAAEGDEDSGEASGPGELP
ncbi:hypothetical protein [Saliphagus infecundisoli]|uniref:Zinc-ribbon domain-containing protein n=1 Tax=Saliphagus infecundisoli TaxID=1849069 RepID=A0ABD5QI67_9EURY|nr:hypothetical protein [Saliphagus infecundisoli]